MSAVPPTPFVPSRLTEGLDEDSVLLAQQPIFEDFSLDETAFWDVPNLGESSRTHQKRPTSRSPSQVWTYDEPYRSLDDETMSLASLEGTVIIGSGERLTRTDEERGSDIGSTRRPMLMPSSSTTSSSKRPRLSSTSSIHQDDYYQRRLSRQTSQTSTGSPSLSALERSASLASSSKNLRQDSRDGDEDIRRLELDDQSASAGVSETIIHVTTQDPDPQAWSPLPRPTILTRFLARSSILHPSSSGSLSRDELFSTPPMDAQTTATTSRLAPAVPDREVPKSSVSSTPTNIATAIEADSPARTAASPSLRRSTSQLILGFFSDLLRSTPSTPGKESRATSPPLAHDNTPGLTATAETQALEPHHVVHASPPMFVAHQEEDDNNEPLHRGPLSEAPYRPPAAAPSREPAGFVPLTRPNKAFVSNTASRAGNPVRRPDPVHKPTRPSASSSFASSALARLPPPGKGSSSAGERIIVKPTERASNLQARRALFERPMNGIPTSSGMTRTIPLVGKTPGKASKARADERNRFDKAVQSRIAVRERQREVSDKRKRIEEEKAYLARRKETVIRANPIPDMYKRG